MINDYHFGGYGKVSDELVLFLNSFYNKNKVPLDPIYTGKMVFGVIDLIRNDFFPNNSKILLIHTGGIQGVKGMNEVLKSKNKPSPETMVTNTLSLFAELQLCTSVTLTE